MGIVYIYGELIQRGLKEFEKVPLRIRNEVYEELVRRGIEDKAIINGEPYTPGEK